MVKLSRKNDKRSRCSDHKDGNRSRRCRAFTSRTINFVRKSLDAWSSIFALPSVPFEPEFETCLELSKAVKTLLSHCPTEELEPLMAFQSIKKGLPDSCRCMESALIDGLVANIVEGRPPVLPRGYLQFVKKEVSRLFPKGWDTSYEGYCRRTSPPVKSCLEAGRAVGGALGNLRTGNRNISGGHYHTGESPLFDHSDYLEVTLFGRPSVNRPMDSLSAALQVVNSAGKPRPLTTFSSDGLYLKPLHKTIYGHLSKKKWLSRGDVTDSSLRSAGFRKDLGTLVSGDYSSATDNLSIEVMESCLSAMLDNASVVPPNVKEFARVACRPFIFRSRDDFIEGEEPMLLKKGQMMGSYLSFPLLCLQNFLAFRWSTRHIKTRIPVLINGDDILFQSDRVTASRWMETVGSLGLVVERTKTSLSDEFGTLNSTLFLWDDTGQLVVRPTFRFGMLRPMEFPSGLGKSFEDFLRGSSGNLRYRAGRVFFDFHLGELKSSRFSLPSLGFRGALAHRLARLYGLVGGRLIGDPPPAPVTHSVCLPHDLICEVPNEFVTSDVVEESSCEIASWKWQHGFVRSDYQRAGIQYAVDSTDWTSDHNVVRLLSLAFGLEDGSFSRWLPLSGSVEPGVSRKTGLKAFLLERKKRDTQRVHYNVALESLYRADWFNCPLPSYTEACAWC